SRPLSGCTPTSIFRSFGIVLPGRGCTTTKTTLEPMSGWIHNSTLTGPTFLFSMMGNGGPICAGAGCGMSNKAESRNGESRDRVIFLAGEERSTHIHGLQYQPDRAAPDEHVYHGPRRESAPGCSGLIFFGDCVRPDHGARQRQDEHPQLDRLYHPHRDAGQAPEWIAE